MTNKKTYILMYWKDYKSHIMLILINDSKEKMTSIANLYLLHCADWVLKIDLVDLQQT